MAVLSESTNPGLSSAAGQRVRRRYQNRYRFHGTAQKGTLAMNRTMSGRP